MSSEEVRARLEALFHAIRDDQTLSIDCAVPRRFLTNNIRLRQHDFLYNFQIQQPPILFEPLRDLNRYPININRYKDDPMWKRMSYDFDPYHPSNEPTVRIFQEIYHRLHSTCLNIVEYAMSLIFIHFSLKTKDSTCNFYNTCDSQSILHGELEVIITAMRNRANQLVEEDEDEEEEYKEEDEDILVDDYASGPWQQFFPKLP
ncbi:hypothetical protein ZTR_06039 [Talaromyces verruculosus]|nr:hypothetical protein ZTR_06039 [Talaromyces verruculosus]